MTNSGWTWKIPPAFITIIEAETEDDAITAAAKYADTAPDNIEVYKFNPLEQL